MLVTNELGENGQAKLFRDGVHLATYREHFDLLDKLAFYLGREATREKIAAAGRAEVLANHTYGHRMERILREAEDVLSRTVVQPSFAPRIFDAELEQGRGSLSFPDPSTARVWTGETEGDYEGEGRVFSVGATAEPAPSTRPSPQKGRGRSLDSRDQPPLADLPYHNDNRSPSPERGEGWGEGVARDSDQRAASNVPDVSGDRGLGMHDPVYFGHARPEIIAMVPMTA